MIDIITSIKKRIAWIEKEEGNLTEAELLSIEGRLKTVDGELARFIMVHKAVNRYPTIKKEATR